MWFLTALFLSDLERHRLSDQGKGLSSCGQMFSPWIQMSNTYIMIARIFLDENPKFAGEPPANNTLEEVTTVYKGLCKSGGDRWRSGIRRAGCGQAGVRV
ncbi:unnamed protein product [Pleuronectes platessa]|uniref:Uncharacterized protein n=1 Tax=Pleuronectes platessa TaxID=8262 RepID=A0A9N7TLK8_PLEPL|nr:unnamed protein product [Pleuronectes platessa]